LFQIWRSIFLCLEEFIQYFKYFLNFFQII
jgi:hypothetical protein